MDIAILAGGRGTRLKGIWNRPKCLVPVGDVPLLYKLFDAIALLHPKTVVLALGHLSAEVDAWIIGAYNHWPWPFGVNCSYETTPLGTGGALRNAIFNTTFDINAPLLVLNGDTLPLYNLEDLVKHHTSVEHLNFDTTSAYYQNQFAGAAVIGPETLKLVQHSSNCDWDVFLIGGVHYPVAGFLDVGTPEGFGRAQG